MSAFSPWDRAHFKTPKGARLRMAKATAAKAVRSLSALYRTVYQRDGYRCVVCRAPVDPASLEPLKRAHPHHIVPRSLAGTAIKHTTANLCTVCPICHADIGDKVLSITGNADRYLTIRRKQGA
jgi:5-methylcytosine-specific restriction endonuclease McrA